MSDVKITDLTELTDVELTDLLVVVDLDDTPVTTKKASVSSILDKILPSFINSYNDASFNTTTSVSAAFGANLSTFGTRITKTSSSVFTTNYNGFVKVSYSLTGVSNTNDRGFSCHITKNGVAVPGTNRREMGKNVAERTGAVAGTFIMPCAPTNNFSIMLTSLEGADISVPIGFGSVLVEFVKEV